MEGISLINLDELLPITERKHLMDMSVKKYVIPIVPIDTYRVFYRDKTYEDVQAENAFEVKNICKRKDINKIVAFRACYPEILSAKRHEINNVANIPLSSVKPVETIFHEYDLSKFNEAFELLDLTQYQQLYSS